nr:uncharacterized protein LOC109413067 [Aedes albopictus]
MDSIFERYQKGTSFTNWSERLGYFFNAVKITDAEMKKAYLITLLDAAMFSELKLLVSNRDLELVPYEEIVQRLRDRYDRKECDFILRYKFNNRVQQSTETVQDFIHAVKLQSEVCGFGNFKETAIVDRVVFGIRDKVLQRRLLCEDDLTLKSMEKIVATWELTVMDQSEKRPVKERLGVVPRSSAVGTYYEDIGGENNLHSRAKKYSGSICGFCGKRGHVTRRCFELKAAQEKDMMDVDAGSRAPVKMTTDNDDDDYNWKRSKIIY